MVDAENLPPRDGRQYEIGLKGLFVDGTLSVQIGLYYLQDEDRAVNDPLNDGFLGRSLQGLDLIARYADTDLDDDPSFAFGEIVPKHSFTAWGQYTLKAGALEGLRLGAVSAPSATFSRSMEIPGSRHRHLLWSMR